MGDFQRHGFETVHELHLSDAQGKPLGRIHISAAVTRSESWAHLKGTDRVAAQPAGPHNRRIVSTRTGFTATAYGQLGPELTRLVEELNAHQGLPGDSVISFEDPGFEAAIRARLAKLEVTVTVKS